VRSGVRAISAALLLGLLGPTALGAQPYPDAGILLGDVAFLGLAFDSLPAGTDIFVSSYATPAPLANVKAHLEADLGVSLVGRTESSPEWEIADFVEAADDARVKDLAAAVGSAKSVAEKDDGASGVVVEIQRPYFDLWSLEWIDETRIRITHKESR